MQAMNGRIFAGHYALSYIPCMNIGNRLDEAMKNARFASQSDLSRASGVPQATISRILKGDGKKGPESDTVRRLAEACRVSFEWLNQGIGKQDGPVVSVLPRNKDLVSGDEVVRLLNLYRQATDDARKRIVLYAQQAEKTPSALKRVASTPDND